MSPEERRARQEWLSEIARLHHSAFVRRSAMVALRAIGSPLVRPISLLVLTHGEKNQNLRETAIKCLGDTGTEDDVRLLEELVNTEHIARFGKLAAANALARLTARLHGSARTPVRATAPESAGSRAEPYFDVAISFAGEDRSVAEALAQGLRARSLRVFYDMFYQAELIGEDLAQLLARIYSRASLFCIVLISKHYPQKRWPQFELAQIQDGVIVRGGPSMVPVRIDETRVDGISATLGYIDLRLTDVDKAVDLIARKVDLKRSGGRTLSEELRDSK
jgi:hypothetical protein